MAVSSISRSARMTDLRQTQISPQKTRMWTEPPNGKLQRVPVVYYLSRNGQLEHPHFMEVPLSSPRGLFLSDVINRLNSLRGKGIVAMYSWSYKRRYRNRFVWHDLSGEDFIYPTHRNEYILKGSEMPESNFVDSLHGQTSQAEGGDMAIIRGRNQSCSSIDFNNLPQYNVYRAEISGRSIIAADASTQTYESRRRRRLPPGDDNKSQEIVAHRDEIEMINSPPADSSPETLETLMKIDGRLILRQETDVDNPTASGHRPIARGGAKSSVLMQLISCGSISFKDCGAGGPGLISHYKMRLPRSGGTAGIVKLEEKEYFSGSLVETKKKAEFSALKRSTSYNADRSSKLEISCREIEGVSEKCISRKPRNPSSSSTKAEGITDLSRLQ